MILAADEASPETGQHLQACAAVIATAEATRLDRALDLQAAAVVIAAAETAGLNVHPNLQSRFHRRLHLVVSFLSALRARP